MNYIIRVGIPQKSLLYFFLTGNYANMEASYAWHLVFLHLSKTIIKAFREIQVDISSLLAQALPRLKLNSSIFPQLSGGSERSK